MCEFCRKYNFELATAKVDETGASISVQEDIGVSQKSFSSNSAQYVADGSIRTFMMVCPMSRRNGS